MRYETRLVLAFVFSALLWVPTAEGETWDHVHLTVPDTLAAAMWYAKHFDGELTKAGPFDAVWFGTNLMKFSEGESVPGSKESAIYHIAFSVEDVQAKAASLRDDGAVRVDTGARGPRRAKVVGRATDPWGTRIELIDDEELRGFHHVHLKSLTPLATRDWYTKVFGGEATQFKDKMNVKAIRYPEMYVFFQSAIREVAPTHGRSIDHIGWRFEDYDAIIRRLKVMKTKFLVEPKTFDGHSIAFIEGPDGVKIEIVEATSD